MTISYEVKPDLFIDAKIPTTLHFFLHHINVISNRNQLFEP